MRRWVLIALVLASAACTGVALSGRFVADVAGYELFLLVAKLCLAALAIGLVVSRDASGPTVLRWVLCACMAAVGVPLYSYGLAAGVAIAASLVALAWYSRSGKLGFMAGAAGSLICGLLRLVVELAWPDQAPLFGMVVLAAAGAVAAVWLIYRTAIWGRLTAWATAIPYVAAALLVSVPLLSPGMQFNVSMMLLIIGFIISAAFIASLFTFLLLKSFDKLDDSFVASYLFFLPVTCAPGYLVARELMGLGDGQWGESWRWVAIALAIDAVLLVSALLLWLVRLAGRGLGPRYFVPLVAWKFLRSQRLVPTSATRRCLRLRSLLEADKGRNPMLAVALEICLAGLCGAGLYLAAGHFILSREWVILAQTGSVTAAALWLSARAVRARCGPAGALAVSALVAGGLACWLVHISSGLAQATYPRVVTLVIACIPAAIVAAQFGVRLFLHWRQRRGRLPVTLNPRFAPRMETVIKQGVGASVFSSVVGVAIGVWALIVVLSVMSGFSGELKRRIVTTKDHVMVKASQDIRELTEPLVLAREALAIPGVVSATVYVEGEAMMSSSVNISATVTIRGIDRWSNALAFLEPSLVAGSLEFFRHPEDLVPFPGIYPYYQLPEDADLDLMTPAGTENELPEMPEVSEESLASEVDIPEDDGEFEGLFPMPPMDGEDTSGDSVIAGAGLVEHIAHQNVVPPVIIGQELARSLGAGVGSRIDVISPDGDVGPLGVQPKARSFLVAAIFSTGMYEYDLKLAYMYLPDAQRFFNMGDAVDHVDIRLQELDTADLVRDQIGALGSASGSEIMTWQEMNRNLFSALKLERVVMFIVLGFIILIASFNIVSSLIIIIRKRLSAIAILRTMGAGARDITRIFFLLGSAAGFFGIASGVIMGLTSCGIIRHMGLTLPREYYIRSLPLLIDGWQITQIALAAFCITALAALYPGRLAARALLVEGLKDER